jgi:hypothetical protein
MKQNLISAYSFNFLDEILVQHHVNLLSLNPHKSSTTSFAELGSLIGEKTIDIELVRAMQEALATIVYAQLQNFPENIFWDFDFLVSSMLKQALLTDGGGVRYLESFTKKMVSLSERFGIHHEIRFRYVHDFIYGFVWAKWVQKEPQSRAHIQPFDLDFLDYLLIKGQEILQQIQLNTYPKLCDTGFRNPFSFSREPDAEYRLFMHLAKKRLIPVTVWKWNAKPVWNRPFHQRRQQLALRHEKNC